MRENGQVFNWISREKEKAKCKKLQVKYHRRKEHKDKYKGQMISREWDELKHIHKYINIMLYNFITKK